MSLEIIKKEINRFLESAVPEVLAIRGKWGVGKTYTWNEILKECEKQKVIALNEYSYVSLFGINSIEDFKNTVFMQMIANNIGTKSPGQEWTDRLRGFWKLAKNIGPLKDLPDIDVSSMVSKLLFSFVKETIICIDDFERKGSGLSLRDLLGVVSLLKEQKQCKVVLIFNDSEFESAEFSEYEKFREKFIDIELVFDASSKELVDIAFPDPKESADTALPEKSIINEKLKTFSEKLGINNIRILKKIERLGKQLDDKLNSYESEVMNQAAQSLVLYSWCFYSKDEKIPSFEFVTDVKRHFFNVDRESGNLDKKHAEWNLILRNYGHSYTSAFDLVIAAAVEHGYINDSSLQKEAKNLNEQIIQGKSEKYFFDAWKTVLGSFDNNPEEVIQILKSSVYNNYKYINPLNLDEVVCFFRKIGDDQSADEITAYYFKDENCQQRFDLSADNSAYGKIKDAEIKRQVDNFLKVSCESKSLKDILLQISTNPSLKSADTKQLANASVDEFIELFKSVSNKELLQVIYAGLLFGNISNSGEDYMKINQSVRQALSTIGKESQLNTFRVSTYGINVD
ncbi:MAG: hypothetical protein WC748_08165 [Legionellales bacterium]|jgi:hypothetical protein